MSQITTFGLVAILAVLGSQALGVAFVSGEAVFSVDREAVSFDGSGSLVDASSEASEFGADVRVSYNGTELVEGQDYEFDESTGELSRLNSSSVPSGEDVRVSYEYYKLNQESQTANSVLSTLVGVAPYLLLVLAALFVVGRVL